MAEPHVLCLLCERVCRMSQLLHSIPISYEGGSLALAMDVSQRPNKRESFDHCASLSDLKASYLAGCHLCTLLWHDYGGPEELEDRVQSEPGLVVVVEEDQSYQRCVLFVKGGTDHGPAMDRLSVYTSRDRRAGPLDQPVAARLALSTESDVCFSLAAGWMKDCISHHPACCRDSLFPNLFPTRVLDLGSYPMKFPPKLYIRNPSSKETFSYATLSHVWGVNTDHVLKLTTANCESLKRAIPMQSISQTFRDAVTIAGRLGYRYLWIDSLCIIQDSEDDWRRESLRMVAVYGNSSCNIGAVASSGCFVRRNPLSDLPCQLSQTQGRALYAQPYYETFEHESALYLSEMFNRAWVLQERLVSPRNLYYGSSGLFWECRHHRASDSFPNGGATDPYGDASQAVQKSQFEQALRPLLPQGSDEPSRLRFTLLWHSLVNCYTRAQLTFAKDRLIALSGVAQLAQKATGLTFLAGLWKETLPLDLLWHTTAYGNVRVGTGPRPSAWRAPTWSWASIGDAATNQSSPVWFFEPSRFKQHKLTWFARIEQCDCPSSPQVQRPRQVPTSTILGELAPGSSITIRGYVTPPMKWRWAKKPMCVAYHHDRPGGVEYRFGQDFDLDTDRSLSADIVFLLVVCLSPSLPYWQSSAFPLAISQQTQYHKAGLVLSPYEAMEDCYTRIGFFHIQELYDRDSTIFDLDWEWQEEGDQLLTTVTIF